MNEPKQQPRLWAWDLSARVYRLSYVQVAHQVDTDLLAYLGERLAGALVADCGCGPGVVTAKFLQAGAAQVVAIDSNAAMIHQASALLAKPIATGHVLIRQASYEADILRRLRQQEFGGRGFDIILFKRSLYMPRQRALSVLQQAAAALHARGTIVVVHPELSLRRYAFAPPRGMTSYTAFHLVNRALSRALEWCGAEDYTLYSRSALLALLREAVPAARVECVPSRQRPYNLTALHMP